MALTGYMPSTQDEGTRKILERGLVDSPFFCKTFMPEAFSKPYSDHHLEAWKLFDDDSIPQAAVCGYRALGKSAMCKGKAVQSVCYRKCKHIAYVGQSLDYAMEQIDAIKMELITNPMIKAVFGEMKATKYEGVDLAFNKVGYYLVDPKTGEPFCHISALGAKQSPRGMNVFIKGQYVRPDLTIIDDLEDDEDVQNSETRQKIWIWLNGSLKEFVSEERPNPKTGRWDIPKDNPYWTPPWRFFYMDTFKHEDAAMAKLLESPDWVTCRLEQGEPVFAEGSDKVIGYKSSVPSITDAQLNAEADKARRGGFLDTFYREKLCRPMAQENKSFTRSMFQYYSEAELVDRVRKTGLSYDRDTARFIIVDPAKTSNPKNAYSAILGVAINPVIQKVYMRDLVCKHLDPIEVIEATLEMALALNTRMVWVENTGLEEWVEHLFRNEARARRIQVNLRWLDARARVGQTGDYGTGKDAPKRARAGTIQPYYKQRYVLHADHLMQSQLEQQMLSYPGCTMWDAIDCAGYVPRVMQELGIYWTPAKQDEKSLYRRDFEDAGLDRLELRERIRRGDYMVCN